MSERLTPAGRGRLVTDRGLFHGRVSKRKGWGHRAFLFLRVVPRSTVEPHQGQVPQVDVGEGPPMGWTQGRWEHPARSSWDGGWMRTTPSPLSSALTTSPVTTENVGEVCSFRDHLT